MCENGGILGMIKQIKRAIVNFFLGDNYFLRSIINKQAKHGKYFKATAMMILTAPFHKILTPEKIEITLTTSMNYYSELHKLLHIAKVEDFDLVRIGRDNDGGYILLDDFKTGGIAYSFGISNDVSFDKDIASKGYDVFMYDHTIEGLPKQEKENPRFHFFRQGIADGKTQDERLKSLEYFISQNHHENQRDMILKMDVEGAEWGFLESVKTETLSQFSQLIFEFHGINNPYFHKSILNTLKKINKTHQLVHLHGQNWGQNWGHYISIDNKIFCDQIEVLYVLRDKYNFIDNYSVKLPIDIDMPAIPREEIKLGEWNQPAKFDDDKMKIIIPV